MPYSLKRPAPLLSRLSSLVQSLAEKIATWVLAHEPSIEAFGSKWLAAPLLKLERTFSALAHSQWSPAATECSPDSEQSARWSARWMGLIANPDELPQHWLARYALAIEEGLVDRPAMEAAKGLGHPLACLMLAPWFALWAVGWEVSESEGARHDPLGSEEPSQAELAKSARHQRWTHALAGRPLQATGWLHSAIFSPSHIVSRGIDKHSAWGMLQTLLAVILGCLCLFIRASLVLGWASLNAAAWPLSSHATMKQENARARQNAVKSRDWASLGELMAHPENNIGLDSDRMEPYLEDVSWGILARPCEWAEASLSLSCAAASRLDPWQRSMAALVMLDWARSQLGLRCRKMFADSGALSLSSMHQRIFVRSFTLSSAQHGAWVPALAQRVMADPSWRTVSKALGTRPSEAMARLAYGGDTRQAMLTSLEKSDPLAGLDWLLLPSHIRSDADASYAEHAGSQLGRNRAWNPATRAVADTRWIWEEGGFYTRDSPAFIQARGAFQASTEANELSRSMTFQDTPLIKTKRRSSRI